MPEESKILKVQLQMVTTERAEMEKQHLQAIAEIEKAHIRELMQKDIDLAKKEASIREEIRREMRDEYEEQIHNLRSQLLDLTTQYHKLVLKK
jgi:ribosome recycling factor